MNSIQPLLTGCKGISQLEVQKIPKVSVTLTLGCAYIECVPDDPHQLVYMMMVGRLHNLGYSQSKLEALGHDHRTIRNWSEGVKETDPQKFGRAFSGRGPTRKLSDEAIRYAQFRYAALRATTHNYRKLIKKEIADIFRVDICDALLRPYFREVDRVEQMRDGTDACESLSATDDQAEYEFMEVDFPCGEDAATSMSCPPCNAPEPFPSVPVPDVFVLTPPPLPTPVGAVVIPGGAVADSAPPETETVCAKNGTITEPESSPVSTAPDQALPPPAPEVVIFSTDEEPQAGAISELSLPPALSPLPEATSCPLGSTPSPMHQPVEEAPASPSERPARPTIKEPPARANNDEEPPFFILDSAKSRNYSPGVMGLPLSNFRPNPRYGMHYHAGQILAAIFLDVVLPACSQYREIFVQWIGQILQGAPNIEQVKNIAGHDLARFTGGRSYTDETQREKLAVLARDRFRVEALYMANSRALSDGFYSGTVFYFDPHTKEYTGELNYLFGWCGRIHGTTRVLHMDMIHSESGSVVWCSHHDNYFDMRVRFFFTLDDLDRVFGAGRERTFVIDRGIFGLDILQKIMARPGVNLITWEKGYNRKGWSETAPKTRFTMVRKRNNSRDDRTYHFEAFETPWEPLAGVRRIIVRATNPEGRVFEASVLCTHASMTLERAVRLIFNRWIQENDLCMLDTHYGIMELTSRRSERYADIADQLPDQMVDSIEYRTLKKNVRALEADQKDELLSRENIDDALASLRPAQQQAQEEFDAYVAKLQAYIDRLKKSVAGKAEPSQNDSRRFNMDEVGMRAFHLKAQLEKNRRRILKLEQRRLVLDDAILARKTGLDEKREQLDDVEQKDSRLRLLVAQDCRRPDTSAKALMDASRILARNCFGTLMRIFEIHYDNLRDDDECLRMMLRAPGFLTQDGDTIEVRLWVCSDLQPATLKAFNSFLADISDRINNHFVGRASAVKICIQNPGY